MSDKDTTLIWEAYTDDKSARKFIKPESLNQIGGFKSRSILVEIPLDDFLILADPLPEHLIRPDAENYFKKHKIFEDVPLLITDGERVKGHEGRHRALLFKKMGMETMPVEFRDYSIRWDETDPSEYPDYIISEKSRKSVLTILSMIVRHGRN